MVSSIHLVMPITNLLPVYPVLAVTALSFPGALLAIRLALPLFLRAAGRF